MLRIFVAGHPVPQGSKDTFWVRGSARVNVVESAKGLDAWRKAIKTECLLNDAATPKARFGRGVPVAVDCVFVLRRVSSLRKTGPTPAHTKKPDGDKLLRAVGDALTHAGVLVDDAQVVDQHAYKRYAQIGEPTGAHITVWHFNPTDDYRGDPQ